jgi:hypothetical protein
MAIRVVSDTCLAPEIPIKPILLAVAGQVN